LFSPSKPIPPQIFVVENSEASVRQPGTALFRAREIAGQSHV
jgi:hypothetical protein